MVVVSEKPWFAPCYRTFHLLKMWKKFRFSWIKKFLFGSWDLALAWLIYWFVKKQGKTSIWLISKKIFFRKFCKFLFQKWESAFHYPSDFSIFLVIFGNDIFWNWSICIWKMVSTFPLWQFSRASFFAHKNITKKLILEFPLGTPHLVGYGSQKEFPFDRCTYRGSLFLHFFQQF